MISKELLSEVLLNEYDSKYFKESSIKYNTLHCYIFRESKKKDGTGAHSWVNINIYELAHKCKEWAFEKEYTISSEYIPKGDFTSSWAKVHDWLSNDDEYLFKCNGDSEPEAIFKACQWILENK